MGRKPDSADREAGGNEPLLANPIDDDLRELYAKYGEGDVPARLEDLAAGVDEAWRDRKRRRSAARTKKVQTAE